MPVFPHRIPFFSHVTKFKQSMMDCRCSMKNAMKALALVGLAALLSCSCNNPFDPRGPVDRHLVVFTVLSTDRNTQYVSVTTPFMPSGYGAGEFYASDVSVTDAIVTIQGYTEGYVLRDTTLSRPDSSQFTSPLRLYAVTPFTPKYRVRYSVSVWSQSLGTATASVMMPSIPDISLVSGYINLLDPLHAPPDNSIDFLIKLPPFAFVKGYVARLFVDFDIPTATGLVRDRVQMPTTTFDTTTYGLAYPMYPRLVECPSISQFTVSFKAGYLTSILKEKMKQYAGRNWVYKQVVFQLLQADVNLYSYCVASQLNSDPRSIRLDLPPYPTLSNGNYGMVGGYSLDSLVFDASGVQH